jgi:hypothetical protein
MSAMGEKRHKGRYGPLMANGGRHGTPDEWQRLEAPLLALDPVFETFAARHGLELSRNAKDWPERSLRWGGNPSFLIQMYLESETGPGWNVWLCCSEDRSDRRYWRNEFAVHGEPVESIRDRLPHLLEDSFNRLESWGADPSQLEFATMLTPMPGPNF